MPNYLTALSKSIEAKTGIPAAQMDAQIYNWASLATITAVALTALGILNPVAALFVAGVTSAIHFEYQQAHPIISATSNSPQLQTFLPQNFNPVRISIFGYPALLKTNFNFEEAVDQVMDQVVNPPGL